MSQLAEQIADRLMYLSGIGKMGTMLTPGIAARRECDEIRGGSYCRSEVVRAIDEVISKVTSELLHEYTNMEEDDPDDQSTVQPERS